MKNKRSILLSFSALSLLFSACGDGLAPVAKDALKPTIITEQTPNDTDDPAIWIHPQDASKSLIIGTDKSKENGGLYAFDMNGKIVNKVTPLDRPNNVDVAYGIDIEGTPTDIAVVTERNKNQIRIYSLPELQPVDGGGIAVFEGETQNEPMGIALYTDPDTQCIYAIVGRKEGPSGSYLWQYELYGEDGTVKARKVREFGSYSGKKEIEAIAVDNELGYVYYSDETVGVKKYYANPDKGNEELALFGTEGFKRDHEGIAIYKTSDTQGYILVSNQQQNSFMVYPREGTATNPNEYPLLVEIPVSTVECDGADATSVAINAQFPKGFFVAMSNGNVFQIYDWRLLEDKIRAAQQP
ncbi:MAG: phytase [Capnocytophaga sp.]|nr:phytase [Capnocytophaga sp.]